MNIKNIILEIVKEEILNERRRKRRLRRWSERGDINESYTMILPKDPKMKKHADNILSTFDFDEKGNEVQFKNRADFQKAFKSIWNKLAKFGYYWNPYSGDETVGESLVEASNENYDAKINFDDMNWYIKKIDQNHLYFGTDPKKFLGGGFNTYHVRQLKDRPYYNDLVKFLGGRGKMKLVYNESVRKGFYETFENNLS